MPIDEIVGDATFVDEQAGQRRSRAAGPPRTRSSTAPARIKDVIQKVGRTLPPTDAACRRRADKREQAQGQARAGGRWRASGARTRPTRCSSGTIASCETAQRGSEAESLFRHSLRDRHYDAVISGVKLPDMSGYELMMRLKPMVEPVPLILTQEFGWDAGHTLVKCRAGRPAPQRLRHQAVQGAATARHGGNDHRLVERRQGVSRRCESA